MRPRQFSIASSVKKYPYQIHLCVAIVRYRTKLKTPRKGVCTTFLASLRPGDMLRIGIQKGLLQLPLDLNTQVICIGPGTGVAPMRSLIQERISIGATACASKISRFRQKNNHYARGQVANTLYFGCRSSTKDEHYGTEWRTLSSNHHLSYRVAFSRDGPEGVKRTYVQDLIRQDAERIWKLLEAGAWVYISGSSNKMPVGVKDAIGYVAESRGGHSSKKYIDDLIRQGRLLEECWS